MDYVGADKLVEEGDVTLVVDALEELPHRCLVRFGHERSPRLGRRMVTAATDVSAASVPERRRPSLPIERVRGGWGPLERDLSDRPQSRMMAE
jgi:hypothetical protein